jgi:hypothetical protein
MRALLVLGALLTWLGCLAAAVTLTGYLVVTTVLAVRARLDDTPRSHPPPRLAAVVALVVCAVGMAGIAVAMAGLASAPDTADISTASNADWGPVQWAALPTWAALAAAATAVVLWRRRRIAAAGEPGV